MNIPVSPFPGAVLATNLDPGAQSELALPDFGIVLLAYGIRAAGAALLGHL